MRFTGVLGLVVVGLAGVALGAAESSPATRAEAFYRAYVASGASGLPEPAQQQRLAPWLSPKLLARFDAARAIQAECISLHPTDKPPLIEGDLFSSLFEGAQAFDAGDAGIEGNTARVTMRFRYGDESSADVVRWSDTYELVRASADAAWTLDDIVYGGEWAFGPGRGTRLATLLDGLGRCE
ncbi:hypothetical protein ACQQ2N_15390 [Dokdonella sp. MW10]|uniref:hypothetical protein n=1 Tax=Dokdonella sp. MW10 TaxID=2992926 RepID=UPI003F80BB01